MTDGGGYFGVTHCSSGISIKVNKSVIMKKKIFFSRFSAGHGQRQPGRKAAGKWRKKLKLLVVELQTIGGQ